MTSTFSGFTDILKLLPDTSCLSVGLHDNAASSNGFLAILGFYLFLKNIILRDLEIFSYSLPSLCGNYFPLRLSLLSIFAPIAAPVSSSPLGLFSSLRQSHSDFLPYWLLPFLAGKITWEVNYFTQTILAFHYSSWTLCCDSDVSLKVTNLSMF